ncbi:HD domain-containing protein [Candidatus Woesearchaeota archaeon]|nr:HD domain-containing protein [Candidatus Woesearchaeota archaeon]
MISSNLIELAREYCVHFHEGQWRKGRNQPYSTHPIEVAGILSRYGYTDVITQCIALLHDVVEDTEVITGEIKDRFGYEIANGVFVLSKNTIREGTRQSLARCLDLGILTEDQLYKVRLSFARDTVKRVKIADMIHNTQDLASLKKPESIERKVHDAEIFYIPLGREVAPLMVKELETNIGNYHKLTEQQA